MSQMRQKDDIWNPLCGGLGSGVMLYTWFRNPLMTIPTGLIWGSFMSLLRFSLLPEGTSKLAFDLNKVGYGVWGGPKVWFEREGYDDGYENKFYVFMSRYMPRIFKRFGEVMRGEE